MPTAQLNGIRLYYEVHGRGFPLVLAHGFAGTAQSWAPQIPALSAHHRLILYDARGHWRSESPKDPRAYSQEIAAADLGALLARLKVKRAIVGGLSMGGVVAMTFYLKYPERVRALILADTGPGFRNPEAREGWNRSRGEVARLLEQDGIRGFADSPHAALDYYTPREIMLQLDPTGLAHTNRGILTFHDSSLIDQLPTIAVPTLIIVGANDTDFVQAAAYMQRKISGSELVVLEAAGHGSNVDQPEAFNHAVLDFLNRRLAH
jgi:pimeloyl-ACP methyl ester carboxylesterase